MSIPSGTTDFPLGHNFSIRVGGRLFLLDAIDLPENTTRVINRTNQDGDASDYQIRQAGERITGTATLQRLDTSTKPPKSGDSIIWNTEDDANADYMLGYVTDVKVARSKDSADVFEIGFLVEDFLDINYGITTGDFVNIGGDSFTATGDTGFTVDVGTTNTYSGLALSEPLTAGQKLYCSFNVAFDSGSPSPLFSLRDSVLNGANSDLNYITTEGFHYIELSSSSIDADYVAFGEGSDGFNSGITVTDFQISRSPLTSTKAIKLSNVGGLSNTEFFFAQGDLNGFGQKIDTTSGGGLFGIDNNNRQVGVIKYDLSLPSGTTKTIQLKVAYPTTKQISGTHTLSMASNFTVLSTEVVSGKKHSIIQVDATISHDQYPNNSVVIGINLEDA